LSLNKSINLLSNNCVHLNFYETYKIDLSKINIYVCTLNQFGQLSNENEFNSQQISKKKSVKYDIGRNSRVTTNDWSLLDLKIAKIFTKQFNMNTVTNDIALVKLMVLTLNTHVLINI